MQRKQIQTLFWTTGLLLAAGIVVWAILRPTYTSRSLLSAPPDESFGLSSLIASAAAQSGIGAGALSAQLELPRNLAVDDQVLSMVALRKYQSSDETEHRRSLAEYFKETDGDSAGRALETAKKIRDHLSVDVDASAGTLEFNLTLHDSLLSYSALRGLIGVVDSLNRSASVQQAAESRKYLEQQTDEAESNLRVAEENLADFLKHNRTYATDPELAAEYQRRTRVVDIRSQLLISLQGQLAQARLDEAKRIPTLTDLVPATPPAERDDTPLETAIALAVIVVGSQLTLWRFGRRFVLPRIPSGWSRARRWIDAIVAEP